MKHKIMELSIEHLKLMKRLYEGYPTLREKLNELFFDKQEITDVKFVITEYFERTLLNESSKPTKTRIKTRSARMFSGRTTIMVAYPRSGKIYEGRIKTLKDMCLIEPIKHNRAFWLVERKYLDNNYVVDLNVIPHIRQYHNKIGRELASEFR